RARREPDVRARSVGSFTIAQDVAASYRDVVELSFQMRPQLNPLVPRSILTVAVIAIGIVTILYIGTQFLIHGPAAAHTATALDAEIRSIRPPTAATLVKHQVSWKPGRALATESYGTSLSRQDIQDYYSDALRSRGWISGPGSKSKPLGGFALVYHKNDREFHLSFSDSGRRLYTISLLWIE